VTISFKKIEMKDNTINFIFTLLIINDTLIIFLENKLLPRHFEKHPMLLFWQLFVLG
jgi:hypothetical protein